MNPPSRPLPSPAARPFINSTRPAPRPKPSASMYSNGSAMLAAKTQLAGRWLAWVASELYALTPSSYAQMVRRELQRLSA